jgi:hypothetical protein
MGGKGGHQGARGGKYQPGKKLKPKAGGQISKEDFETESGDDSDPCNPLSALESAKIDQAMDDDNEEEEKEPTGDTDNDNKEEEEEEEEPGVPVVWSTLSRRVCLVKKAKKPSQRAARLKLIKILQKEYHSGEDEDKDSYKDSGESSSNNDKKARKLRRERTRWEREDIDERAERRSELRVWTKGMKEIANDLAANKSDKSKARAAVHGAAMLIFAEDHLLTLNKVQKFSKVDTSRWTLPGLIRWTRWSPRPGRPGIKLLTL